jgi:hypothetical protein
MVERATLVGTVVSYVPIYMMCSVKMHVTNLKPIDRAKNMDYGGVPI